MDGAQYYPVTLGFEFESVAGLRWSSSLRVLGMTTRPALSKVTVTFMNTIIEWFDPNVKYHLFMVNLAITAMG